MKICTPFFEIVLLKAYDKYDEFMEEADEERLK